MRHAALIVALLFSTASAIAQPDNIEELAANPKYLEKDIKPSFEKVTAKRLLKDVKVIPSRSYAVFGFNVPEVQIHLPAIDNNVYADIEFSDATLLDENGNEVTYEREDGFYTHEDLASETRFVAPDYGEELVEFAKARGKVTIRYPAVIHTVSAKADDAAAMRKAGLVADGAYVKIYDAGGIARESFTSPIEGLRVYDKAGRRLERYGGWSGGGSDENGSYQAFAYQGVPARFDADVIDDWIGLEFEYVLPPAPKWPKNRQGLAPEDPVKITETPGGTVTGREIHIVDPEVLGWYADMSEADLLEQLQQNGYREISEQNMVLAATGGETDAVRILLAAGVSPDAKASNGIALINAAMFGKDETAMLLIDAGADVNAVDETNSSALLRATNRCGNGELIRALIKAGADVNVQAKGSATPMMMATVMNCEETQKILKEAGAKEWKPGQ